MVKTIIQGNPEESDDDVVQSLVRKAQEQAISQFRHEYPRTIRFLNWWNKARRFGST